MICASLRRKGHTPGSIDRPRGLRNFRTSCASIPIVHIFVENDSTQHSPTTSFDSALGFPPLFVRQMRATVVLLYPGDQREYVRNRIRAQGSMAIG